MNDKNHRWTPQRRSFLATGASLAAALFGVAGLAPTAVNAQAENYPNRAVRIILPFPPGTANDISLRMVAEQLSKRWNQPVIVDNKPGASSIIWDRCGGESTG